MDEKTERLLEMITIAMPGYVAHAVGVERTIEWLRPLCDPECDYWKSWRASSQSAALQGLILAFAERACGKDPE